MTAGPGLEDLLDPAQITSADQLPDRVRDLTAAALVASRTRQPPAPCRVVRPSDTEQVARVLEWAHRTATPVTPYGGGSGVSRGIAPDGGVVVDLSAMDAVVDIDAESRLARVQAGVDGERLSSELASHGLMLGHEPQSLAISTVGGWIATKACGQLSARYGGIEKMVAGLEAVLPGGRVVRSRASPRAARGPDVASLMIGSEGTLGIVTEATLRLAEATTERVDAAVSFERVDDGVAACRVLAQSDLRPTVVRLYDAEDTALLFRNDAQALSGTLLLLSFDGSCASERAERALELTGGRPAGREPVERWWRHRNDAVREYRRLMAGEGVLGPHGLVETIEVSGTWKVIPPLYGSMKAALGSQAQLAACHLSHVYPDGGCLYFTLASACSDDQEALRLNERWWDVAMRACLDAGGSISHHHGIGRLKSRWLPKELAGWWDVLVAVKRALDPKGIMNPGALGL